MNIEQRDVVVVGGGPAGQKAAIQAAKAGFSALVVERDAAVGGHCVHRGTIPSKTLREAALALSTLRQRCGATVVVAERIASPIALLMDRVSQVVTGHESYMGAQLARNDVETWHGRARFVDDRLLEVETVRREVRAVEARFVVLATGSRPRAPEDVPVDHENVFDSDSILSMTYLPKDLLVLGSGVIAYEYACIFQALGVDVTVVDPGERPLPFLDPELSRELASAFVRAGGAILQGQRERAVAWDGVSDVVVELASGATLRADKALYARGRVANVEGLRLDRAGLALDARGNIRVNEHFQTARPHIYAVGDVVGPPSLASASMDQGRRAMRHALGLPAGQPGELVPVGVYTIPEIASVGVGEDVARQRHGGAVVGRALFNEVARGRINGADGMLKLVACPEGRRILGVHVVGEGAAELVHIGQMALVGQMEVDALIETTFNFPTMAEAYRIAALDVLKRRARAEEEAPQSLATVRPRARDAA